MNANEAQKTYGKKLQPDDGNWDEWSNGIAKRPFERCEHGNVIKRQIIGFDKNLERWWDEECVCQRCAEEREVENKLKIAKVEAETAKWAAFDENEEPTW